MDHIHLNDYNGCVKAVMNLHPYNTGGSNNGITEATHLVSVDQVKLEANSSAEELSFIECMKYEDENESFQEEFIQEKNLYMGENAILTKSLKSESDHSLSIDEVKLEDNSSEESSFRISECGNDNEDSKHFQDEFIDGEKIWKREDFILQECGGLRYGEMNEDSFETRQRRRFEAHINNNYETYKGTIEQIKGPHLKLKKHKCHMCEYSTNQKGHLDNHMKGVHLKLKNHTCQQCQYTTSYKSYLKTHINSVHLKLNNFKCQQCQFTTSYNSALKTHFKNVHLKLKNHKCQQCQYTTSYKSYLKTHIESVHLKLKNLKCQQCEYATTIKASLKSHINNVHLKLRKCQQCEYTTTQKSSLSSHINSVHLKLKNHKCQQ